MKRVWTTIRKYKVLLSVILISLVLFILFIPLLLNICFKLTAPHWLFVAEWSADTAINYYGTILTFLGTFSLSSIALWQNQVLKRENDKHTAILEQMERLKSQPIFAISDAVDYGNAKNLVINLTNKSNNVAQEITISEIAIVGQNKKSKWTSDAILHIESLALNEHYKIKLANPEIEDVSDKITFRITYFDIYGDSHQYIVLGTLDDNITKITTPRFRIIKETKRMV